MKAATLGYLVDHDHGLRATCQDCAHQATLPVLHLAEQYGREVDVPTLRRALRCSECGSAKATVSVESAPT
jgi:hypothetical protein